MSLTTSTALAAPVHPSVIAAAATTLQPSLGVGGITLTPDQEAAMQGFISFLLDPERSVFVIEGFAGTGKSTLVMALLDRLPGFQKMVQLIDPDRPTLETVLTATTNKAAENLSYIANRQVNTIHSHLGMRVETDYRTRNTRLVHNNQSKKHEQLIFIDEASYIDSFMLKAIFEHTNKCKIVFMGDPAQLTPVKCSVAPVFKAGFDTVRLTQVMRQAAGSPITQLATQFRETVTSGVWTSFTSDGTHVQYLPRDQFEDEILKEFCSAKAPHAGRSEAKILAWTNQRVIDYNHAVRDRVAGDPEFQVGDYAINNSYVQVDRRSLKTDQSVQITEISDVEVRHGVPGKKFCLVDYGQMRFFMPNNRSQAKQRAKALTVAGDNEALYDMQQWIDLRAVYACTVNKAQGSTYDTVFIDLDDIKRCNSGDQIARMMYVAVSRARHRVVLTGDLA